MKREALNDVHAKYVDALANWVKTESGEFDPFFGHVEASSGIFALSYDDPGAIENVEQHRPEYQEYFERKGYLDCDLRALEWVVDWALVRPDEKFFQYDATTSPHLDSKGSEYTLRQPLKYFSLAPAEYRVYKKGYTSGWTRGRISKAYGINSMYGKLATPGLCLIMVGERSSGEEKAPPVANGGDSGSIVYTCDMFERCMAGLLFGGCPSLNNAHIVPMCVVVKDIELRTGKKVKHPAPAATLRARGILGSVLNHVHGGISATWAW